MTWSRIPMRVMLPGGLAIMFLMIMAISLFHAMQNRSELFMEDARIQVLAYVTEIAGAIEQGGMQQPGVLHSRISRVLTDPRITMVVALDPDMQILLSPHKAWRGKPVESVLPGFDREYAQANRGKRLPRVEPEQTGHAIEAFQSFELPGVQGQRPPENRGIVWARMDLEPSLTTIHNEAIFNRLPEILSVLLIIALTAALFDSQISRPLARLRRAATKVRQEDYDVRLPETGCREIVELSTGFNAMVRAQLEARDRLRESWLQLAVTLDSVGDGLIATDLDGRITLMNPMAERLTGWSREEAIGHEIEDVFVICAAGSTEPIEIPIRRVLADGTLVGLANHTVLVDRHGDRHHIADSAAPIAHNDGTLVGVVLVFHDVSREYQLREALAESEQHFRMLADNGQALIWTADLDQQRDYFNRPWLTFSGLTFEQARGSGWQTAVHPDDLPGLLGVIREAYRERRDFTREYRLRHYSGDYRWLLVQGTPRYNSHGDFIGYMGQCLDVTADKETAAELERLAYHDDLTNLPNRALLLDRVDRAIRALNRHGGVGALFFVDLDEFKQINDIYGHSRGDHVLMEVARRLAGLVRDTDTVARLGGDEFLVLVPDVGPNVKTARSHALTLADKLRHAMEIPFDFDEHQHLGTASIGLTLFAGEVDSAEELVREADIAMYQAKRSGRNNLVNFESGMVESVTRRYRLEQELKMALQNGEFELHLQSQFDRNERLVGAEVLLRWQHPTRGLVSPAEFIPIAEDSGQIIAIGEWILRETCHLLRGIDASLPAGEDRPTISVNVSPRQFRSPDFVERLREILTNTGVDPGLLMIEITENMLVSHASEAIDRMHELTMLGLHFSIDDFGTGYSSFAYLKRLPLTEIKLDKSFVDGVPSNTSDSAMVEAILAMANRLDIDVVAEGVETRDQFDFLKEFGTRRFQGFLFARPAPANEWLDRNLS